MKCVIKGMKLEFLSITTSEAAKKKTAPKAQTHKVVKGDTLYSVAKRYGVSVDSLKKANNMKGEQINLGSILKIPSKPSEPKTVKAQKTHNVQKPAKAVKPAKTNEVKKNPFEPKIVEDKSTYKVDSEVSDKKLTSPSVDYKGPGAHFLKKGQSLSDVEKLYGLRKGELAAYNPKLANVRLETGMKIELPERANVRNVKTRKDAAKALGVTDDFLAHMEKIEKKRTRLYDDGAGNATIGIGHHAFGSFEKKYYKGRTLKDPEIYQLLTKDLAKAKNSVIKTIGKDAYNKMSTNQKEAMIDYVFNRGDAAFRSDDCKPLVNALKKGDYKNAAKHMITSKTFANKNIKLGVTKRRLYEMHHFCGGKYTPEVLKQAQYAYNQGLEGAVTNDSTKAGYKNEIKQLFGGKLKIV